MKKKNKRFPKKAKLITFGGFYKIIPIKEPTQRINHPFMTRLKVVTAEFEDDALFSYHLVFNFDGIKGGYAEYHQVDFVRLTVK